MATEEEPTTARVQLTAQVSPELIEELNTAAEERQLGRGYLVEMLLRQGLADLLPVNQIQWTKTQAAEVHDVPTTTREAEGE